MTQGSESAVLTDRHMSCGSIAFPAASVKLLAASYETDHWWGFFL